MHYLVQNLGIKVQINHTDKNLTYIAQFLNYFVNKDNYMDNKN